MIKEALLTFLFAGITAYCFGQFDSARLQVNGLTCSMCSKATQEQLETMKFIESIETDLVNRL
jgi:hypothetical protein